MVRIIFALMLVTFCSVPRAQTANNLAGTVIASSAQTAATVTSRVITNQPITKIHVIINVTAYTSGNYTPRIQALDVASNTWYDVLVGTAISSTGQTVLKVGAGFTPATNLVVSDMITKSWRVQLTGAATPSMVLSIGFNGAP